jgi:hypothetical protein
MAMTDTTRVNSVLGAMLGINTFPTFTTAAHVRLGSTAPASTTNMTELPGGSGYTTGGSTAVFSMAASGKAQGPGTALSWTNTGATWSIVGIEIWDAAATPLRWFWGTWTGQPISVANGNTFSVATNAITLDSTQW